MNFGLSGFAPFHDATKLRRPAALAQDIEIAALIEARDFRVRRNGMQMAKPAYGMLPRL